MVVDGLLMVIDEIWVGYCWLLLKKQWYLMGEWCPPCEWWTVVHPPWLGGL